MPERELIVLVGRARAGDNAAWTRLVKHFNPMLRRIARSYGLRHADVDDVLQATWLRAFRHIGQIHQPTKATYWLATVARRESLGMLQAPIREYLSDDPRLGDRVELTEPATELLAAERRAILARALGTLPERHRRLMTLLAAETDLDYREISLMLGIPIGSIGPTRARSLARLERHAELREFRGSRGVCG